MPELSVIVPTFNESGNIIPMVSALDRVLGGIDFEVIFVDDDSPDGTAAVVRSVSQRNSRVRIVQRITRRGLSSAVIEGMLASSAPYLAVIDGDMQHDESVLPEILRRLKAEDLDLVIGTRHTSGGSMGDFSPLRIKLSNMGRRISALVAHAAVSDTMSGFFIITRAYFEEVVHNLSGVGFKILLDLLASATRPVRFAEVGYTFRTRVHGESKLNTTVCLEYLELLLDKLIGDWIPVRYAFFGMIGAIGVFAQLGLVACVLYKLPLVTAQTVASLCVMSLNYVLNNRLTFRARRLRGMAWLSGLLGFVLACSIGLYCNLLVANSLNASGIRWLPASLAGICIGSVWNYGVSSMVVWRVNRRFSRVAKATPQPGSTAEAVAV